MALGNLNKHKGASDKFNVLPNGMYGVIIDETSIDKTKAGHDMLVVKYKIVRKLHDNDIDQKNVRGRVVWENFPTNADFRMDDLRSMVIASGYAESDIDKNPDFNGTEVLHNYLAVRVGITTYQGKERNEVERGEYEPWQPGAEEKAPDFEAVIPPAQAVPENAGMPFKI
jgi:hypothetical protein